MWKMERTRMKSSRSGAGLEGLASAKVSETRSDTCTGPPQAERVFASSTDCVREWIGELTKIP
jgi:hypothetical protein